MCPSSILHRGNADCDLFPAHAAQRYVRRSFLLDERRIHPALASEKRLRLAENV